MRLALTSLGRRGMLQLFSVASALILSACGGPGGDDVGPTPTDPTQTPAKVVLVSSKSSLKSDGSDTATITATVLDSGNRVIPNIALGFSSTSGQVVANGTATDASGNLTATFSAGADRSNRTDTVTVTASNGVSGQISVVLSGTSVKLTAGSTSLSAPSGNTSVAVQLLDASGNPIRDQDVALTLTGNGGATLSKASARHGETVTLTAQAAGSVALTATALNATAAVDFLISGGSAFGFTVPAVSPDTAVINTPKTLTVSAPGVATVRFSTTLGTLNGGGATADVAVVAGSASVTFASSTAGTASVSAINLAQPAVSASTVIAVSPAVSDAAQISVQASPSSIPVSFGTTQNSLTVTAKVLSSSGQPVGGVPVSFTIQNPVGGGETLAPSVVYTASVAANGVGIGEARATFTSGTVQSAQGSSGIRIAASVVGNAAITPATTAVLINGVAASVTIGQSSTVTTINGNTAYQLPMSVQVADSGGNPVSGATVTLKVTPYAFSTGTGCAISRTYAAEDLLGSWTDAGALGISSAAIGNLRKDNGEDGGRLEVSSADFTRRSCSADVPDSELPLAYACASLGNVSVVNTATTPDSIAYVEVAGTSDGELTPAQANAGTLPSTVQTDSSGLATFNFNYLKSNSIWTVVKVTATTQVGTTEASQSSIFRLAPARSDTSPCSIQDSPYQY